MPRLSKKAKQEWDFFINPETGRRTYNSLCLKCKNKCKQSHKAIIVFCPKYKSKRGAKSVKNRREYDDSGEFNIVILVFNKKPIQKKKLPILAPNQYRNRGVKQR